MWKLTEVDVISDDRGNLEALGGRLEIDGHDVDVMGMLSLMRIDRIAEESETDVYINIIISVTYFSYICTTDSLRLSRIGRLCRTNCGPKNDLG